MTSNEEAPSSKNTGEDTLRHKQIKEASAKRLISVVAPENGVGSFNCSALSFFCLRDVHHRQFGEIHSVFGNLVARS
jgi:hypothetical protein